MARAGQRSVAGPGAVIDVLSGRAHDASGAIRPADWLHGDVSPARAAGRISLPTAGEAAGSR